MTFYFLEVNTQLSGITVFLARIVDLKNIMAAIMQQDSYSFNQYLNANITEEEVKRSTEGLRKATGN